MAKTGIFGKYDIRGIYPDEVNEEIIYNIARAFVKVFKPKTAAVGRDVRTSSPSLHQAAVDGLTDEGVHVIDIGTISTDMLYFTVGSMDLDGGLTISASHNPREYNGMKLVEKKSKPISADNKLFEIQAVMANKKYEYNNYVRDLTRRQIDVTSRYIKHILSFIDPNKISPLKFVANANFGPASLLLTELQERLPIEVVKINCTIDGTFPKGRPDPLVPENRDETSELIRESKADFGVAWDADADRCFFFSGKGEFYESNFITAILGQYLLKKSPGSKIICDVRARLAISDVVGDAGGSTIVTKPGHSFIKARMREENALFGGEFSGHFYFRDNYFCDNGIIPLLLVLEMLSTTGQTLEELLAPITSKYFVSGEINTTVSNADDVIEEIKAAYGDGELDLIDGVSILYPNWNFNLRTSNTEPGLIRLNIEGNDKELVSSKKKELVSAIRKFAK